MRNSISAQTRAADSIIKQYVKNSLSPFPRQRFSRTKSYAIAEKQTYTAANSNVCGKSTMSQTKNPLNLYTEIKITVTDPNTNPL